MALNWSRRKWTSGTSNYDASAKIHATFARSDDGTGRGQSGEAQSERGSPADCGRTPPRATGVVEDADPSASPGKGESTPRGDSHGQRKRRDDHLARRIAHRNEVIDRESENPEKSRSTRRSASTAERRGFVDTDRIYVSKPEFLEYIFPA